MSVRTNLRVVLLTASACATLCLPIAVFADSAPVRAGDVQTVLAKYVAWTTTPFPTGSPTGQEPHYSPGRPHLVAHSSIKPYGRVDRRAEGSIHTAYRLPSPLLRPDQADGRQHAAPCRSLR